MNVFQRLNPRKRAEQNAAYEQNQVRQPPAPVEHHGPEDDAEHWNPIADANPATGGQGVQKNPVPHNLSYTGSGLYSLPSMPSHLTTLPFKRRPSVFAEELNVPENMGQIPPSETAVNGTFKNQPVTGPQKSIFLTYSADNEKYYDCKIPIKINIPGGDYGLFKVTVNEVLFRNDAVLLDPTDWLSFSMVNPEITFEIPEKEGCTIEPPLLNYKFDETWNQRITMPYPFNQASYSYFSLVYFTQLLQTMFDAAENITEHNTLVPITYFPSYYDTLSGVYYHIKGDDIGENPHVVVTLDKSPIDVSPNKASGNGLSFCTAEISFNHNYGGTGVNDFEVPITIKFKSGFTMACSDHFRNILIPFSTVTNVQSVPFVTLVRSGDNEHHLFRQCHAINIPVLNFAGPLVFMLNTNAQTTCPIANESAAQFQTCALSYNTDITPYNLVQMTSNIPLILKEGMDFRITLTDSYGNPVKIQSPMYVQVTISPFSNAAMAELMQQV